MRYSAFALLKNGLTGNSGWTPAWRKPEPKPAYDAVIVGGGHGLATAYYLAKQHGITNVAVLEKSSARAISGVTPPSSARTISSPATLPSTSAR
jgi:hypothetical protein